MFVRTAIATAMLVAVSATAAAAAQMLPQSNHAQVIRDQARGPYKEGLDHMRTERFAEAIKAFESAIAIDDSFDMAYYMLGRAHMAKRSYAPAVQALSKAKTIFSAEGIKQFQTKQEAQRHRQYRLLAIDDTLQQLRQQPQTPPVLAEIQRLEERKRQLEDVDRSQDSTSGVPGFVSLALGSAYFRTGNLTEAEKAWREAVAADKRMGEAHSNLAVIYMETKRYDEAERAIKEAEKVGFRVNPQLKDEIKKRRAGTD